MFTTATSDLICGDCIRARYRELGLSLTAERLPEELRARWTGAAAERCSDCETTRRFGCQANTERNR